MKRLLLPLMCVALSTPVFAQQTAQKTQETVTVQMVCRDMAKTGNFLAKGETVINGMACHPATATASASAAASSTAAPSAAAASMADPNPASAPSASPIEKSSHKPRVYVTSSDSWVTSGGFAGGASGNGSSFTSASAGHFSGGSDPQTVEIIKNFMQKCPGVIVTENKANADYAVLFDREGGKRGTSGWNGLLRKVDKMAVFSKNGDAIFSESTRSVGTTVKNACSAIEKSEDSD